MYETAGVGRSERRGEWVARSSLPNLRLCMFAVVAQLLLAALRNRVADGECVIHAVFEF